MRLGVLGVGGFGMGFDAPIKNETARIEPIPIKGLAKPAITRRLGRLAQLSYVAAIRALEDGGITDPTEVAIVGATAMGEVAVAVDLISQIQASRGKTISPKLVPNSVHNSPVGYLSIGTGNRMPQWTVSQGWLSAEAALSAAGDLIEGGMADKVLVVAGDEADPTWGSRLAEMGASNWSEAVNRQAFQECASAVVVSKDDPNGRYGSLVAGVERIGTDPVRIADVLKRNGIEIHPEMTVQWIESDAKGGHGRATDRWVAQGLGLDQDKVQRSGPPRSGSLQGGGLSSFVAQHAGSTGSTNRLHLAFELDEMAFIHWIK